MGSTLTQVSTHLVRQHRRARHRVPELATYAEHAATGTPPVRERAARGAVRLLERDVLAQADVEDALVARSFQTRRDGRLRRLRPEYDSLRIGTDRLLAFIETPDDRVDVAGLLTGLGRLLDSHLHDEWHTLLPLLAELSPEGAAPLVGLLPSAGAGLAGTLSRLYVPRSLDQVRDRLTGPGVRDVSARVETAAVAAARRTASRLAVPGAGSLRARVELVPIVSTARVTLLIGRLESSDIETVLAPVEFEVVLTPDGPGATAVELRHDIVPTRPLPSDVPAHDVTAAAVNALAGELALIGIGREPARIPPTANATSK